MSHLLLKLYSNCQIVLKIYICHTYMPHLMTKIDVTLVVEIVQKIVPKTYITHKYTYATLDYYKYMSHLL